MTLAKEEVDILCWAMNVFEDYINCVDFDEFDKKAFEELELYVDPLMQRLFEAREMYEYDKTRG